MTWRSFVEYVTMLDMGQADAVQRNYVVEHDKRSFDGKRTTLAHSAAHRMGLATEGHNLTTLLAYVQARLFDMGYVEPDTSRLEDRMNAWYTWDRIRKGHLRRCKRRPVNNPLL